MNLRFQMQREDVLAFSRAFYAASPTFQRSRTRVRLMLPTMMIILWGYSTFNLGFDRIATGIYVGGSLLWFFLYPLRHARNVEKYSEKFIDEGSGSKNYGFYELKLTDLGIHSTGPMGTSTITWDAVDRVSLTDQYLFIFLNGSSGYPIPIRDIGNDAAVEAQAYIEANKTKQENKSAHPTAGNVPI